MRMVSIGLFFSPVYGSMMLLEEVCHKGVGFVVSQNYHFSQSPTCGSRCELPAAAATAATINSSRLKAQSNQALFKNKLS